MNAQVGISNVLIVIVSKRDLYVTKNATASGARTNDVAVSLG